MRVRISRWLNANILGGNPRLMISSRVYLEHRVFWTNVIDRLFWLLREEHEHCRNSFYHDLEDGKMKEYPEFCAECDKPLDDDCLYVIGAHVYVCDKDCMKKIVTQTFFPLEEKGGGPSQSRPKNRVD